MSSNHILNLPRILLVIGGWMTLIIMNVSHAATSSGVTFSDGFETGNFYHTEGGIHFEGTAGDYGGPVVSSDNPKNGNHSVKFTFKGRPNDGAGESGAKLQYKFDQYIGPDIWVQYDVYFPTNYVPRDRDSGGPNKAVVTWSDSYDNDNGTFTSLNGTENPPMTVGYHWSGSYMYVDGAPYCLFPDLSSDLGHWINMTWHIKFADTQSSSNGVYEIWKNGVLCLQKTGKPNYLRNGTGGVNHLYLFGPQDIGFINDTSVWIDNLVISSDPISYNSGHSSVAPPMPPGITQ